MDFGRFMEGRNFWETLKSSKSLQFVQAKFNLPFIAAIYSCDFQKTVPKKYQREHTAHSCQIYSNQNNNGKTT